MDIAQRWQMKKVEKVGNAVVTRTFIMYGPEREVREYAATSGYTDVEPSGHWDRSKNIIVGAQDGPVTYSDTRFGGRER